MKFIDALMGRTPQAQPDLDALFGLPSAAITLQASADMVLGKRAAVCYKPASGRSFADAEAEMEDTLAVDADGVPLREESDQFGYNWVIVENPAPEDLVTRIHMVNATLEARGFGPQLLCSVFALCPEARCVESTVARPSAYLVYLYKRGTFYPFAPLGGQKRDNECELRLSALLEGELAIEADLTRWFPLWGLPLGLGV
ncbi:MAG: PspA-associated protein PspAB [Acidimicrobiales bacterium]